MDAPTTVRNQRRNRRLSRNNTRMQLVVIPPTLHAKANRDLATGIRNRRAGNGTKAHESVVYFVQAGETGPIKIGWTENVDHRIDHLQLASPERLILRASLRGDRDLERKIHQYFSEHRIRGEWFEAKPVLAALAGARFLGREAA